MALLALFAPQLIILLFEPSIGVLTLDSSATKLHGHWTCLAAAVGYSSVSWELAGGLSTFSESPCWEPEKREGKPAGRTRTKQNKHPICLATQLSRCCTPFFLATAHIAGVGVNCEAAGWQSLNSSGLLHLIGLSTECWFDFNLNKIENQSKTASIPIS